MTNMEIQYLSSRTVKRHELIESLIRLKGVNRGVTLEPNSPEDEQ